MWYVMQVRTGSEENIRKQCEKILGNEILEQCFIPYYEEKKRYRGNWHVEKKILFPGYVFIVSEQLEDLFTELKKVIGFTKLIGAGQEIIPLTEDEVTLLKKLGKEEHVVEMSTGVIENGKVRITNGPLKDMEGFIKKIDRHRRKAVLEIEMFGRNIEMQVGLEVVEKICGR